MYSRISRYDAPSVLGLPKDGKFVIVSNSSMGQLACARKFMFSGVDHLGGKSTRAMDIGTAWDTIMQDVFEWWRVRDTQYPAEIDRCAWCDGTGRPTLEWSGNKSTTPADFFRCPICDGTGKSALHRAVDAFLPQLQGDHDDPPEMSSEDFERVGHTLRRMLEGYMHKWQRGPMGSIQILGTQVGLARPILHPRTGKPFRAATWLERPVGGGEWQTASVGAKRREREGVSELKRVTYPWFQVGLLDVLGRDRQTGMAWVIDVKASGQPSRYANGMGVDPQLPGYCWLLEPHLKTLGLSGVAGFMYDVTHSKFQPDPHELKWAPPKMEDLRAMAEAQGIKVVGRKSEDYLNALGIQPGHGGFSQSQNAGVPSWRYEWALERDGVDAGPYQDHLQWIFENVDGQLYSRPWQKYGPDHWGRYGREVYAKAAQMALLRRGGTMIEHADECDTVFPRTPICMAPGGSCAYAGPCAQDGDDSRREYASKPSQWWGDGEISQAILPGLIADENEVDW